MKRKIICIVICILLIATAVLPVSSISDSENLNKMEKNGIIDSSDGTIIITLNANEYEINDYKDGYAEIIMTDFGSLLRPGEPMLPTKTFFIGLPPGGEAVSIDLIYDEHEEINGNYNIIPSSPIFSNNVIVGDWGPCDEIYRSIDPYPSNFYEYIGKSQMRKYPII